MGARCTRCRSPGNQYNIGKSVVNIGISGNNNSSSSNINNSIGNTDTTQQPRHTAQLRNMRIIEVIGPRHIGQCASEEPEIACRQAWQPHMCPQGTTAVSEGRSRHTTHTAASSASTVDMSGGAGAAAAAPDSCSTSELDSGGALGRGISVSGIALSGRGFAHTEHSPSVASFPVFLYVQEGHTQSEDSVGGGGGGGCAALAAAALVDTTVAATSTGTGALVAALTGSSRIRRTSSLAGSVAVRKQTSDSMPWSFVILSEIPNSRWVLIEF